MISTLPEIESGASLKMKSEDAGKIISNIRDAIKKYYTESRLTYAVFGISGGLDSAVIAGLLSDIEGIKPIGVIMPCESDIQAEQIAGIVLKHYKIPAIRTDLTADYHHLMGHYYTSEGVYGQLTSVLNGYGDNELVTSLPHRKARASGNIKARLRMITLYHIAQLTGGIVISTDNLSELCMGFWTLNGDVGDLSPIQYVFKGLEEHAIAEALGVPREAIDAIPTDGLDVIPGGSDEDQLGLPYKDLDRVIISLLKNKIDKKTIDKDSLSLLSNNLAEELGYEPKRVAHIADQMIKTNFKRNWPKVFSRSDIGLPEIDELEP